GENVPLPNSPWLLPPQDQTLPSLLIARLLAMATTLSRIVPSALTTGPGTLVPGSGVTVPCPSWQSLLRPHVQTVPSALSAVLQPPPSAIAPTLERLGTGEAVDRNPPDTPMPS